MLALLAEGMMSDAAEVAAWLSVVVVGVVRKVAAVDREAVRSGCLVLLAEAAAVHRHAPLVLTDTEIDLRDAIAAGADLASVVARFRLAPERVAYACIRILHAQQRR